MMPSRSPQLDFLLSDWRTAVVEGSHPILGRSPAFVEARLASTRPQDESVAKKPVSELLEGLL